MSRTPPPTNLDVKVLKGRSPWLRLRVGDWRLVFRPLLASELAELGRARGDPVDLQTLYIERIVHRRDLERIVAALP